jgi:hypothetical protein
VQHLSGSLQHPACVDTGRAVCVLTAKMRPKLQPKFVGTGVQLSVAYWRAFRVSIWVLSCLLARIVTVAALHVGHKVHSRHRQSLWL